MALFLAQATARFLTDGSLPLAHELRQHSHFVRTKIVPKLKNPLRKSNPKGNLRGTRSRRTKAVRVRNPTSGRVVRIKMGRKRARTRGRRRRRAPRRRRKRRRISRPLKATRYVPKSLVMNFTYKGQISVTTRPGGWGYVAFPTNIMERPLGELIPVQGTHSLASDAVNLGGLSRQPAGYDRWIDTTTSTAGKYNQYKVLQARITCQFVPATASDDGSNLIGGFECYVGELVDADIYRGLVATNLAPVLQTPSFFKGRKVFNSGQFGTMFGCTWKDKTWQRKFPDRRPDDPLDQVLHHDTVDANFRLAQSRLIIGQFGESTAAAQDLSFLVTITYKVRMMRPTQHSESLDGGAGFYT